MTFDAYASCVCVCVRAQTEVHRQNSEKTHHQNRHESGSLVHVSLASSKSSPNAGQQTIAPGRSDILARADDADRVISIIQGEATALIADRISLKRGVHIILS